MMVKRGMFRSMVWVMAKGEEEKHDLGSCASGQVSSMGSCT